MAVGNGGQNTRIAVLFPCQHSNFVASTGKRWAKISELTGKISMNKQNTHAEFVRQPGRMRKRGVVATHAEMKRPPPTRKCAGDLKSCVLPKLKRFGVDISSRDTDLFQIAHYPINHWFGATHEIGISAQRCRQTFLHLLDASQIALFGKEGKAATLPAVIRASNERSLANLTPEEREKIVHLLQKAVGTVG